MIFHFFNVGVGRSVGGVGRIRLIDYAFIYKGLKNPCWSDFLFVNFKFTKTIILVSFKRVVVLKICYF